MVNKVDTTISNLRALNYFDDHNKITSEGLMFLERSQYKEKEGRIQLHSPGYLEKQILTEISQGVYTFEKIRLGDLDQESVNYICRSYMLHLYSQGYLSFEDGRFAITDKAKELLYKDNYKITKYDAKNIVDASIEGVFTFNSYLLHQRSLGKSEEEIMKGFESITKRLENHIYHGMVQFDGDRYILSNEFIQACGKNPTIVKKDFKLNDYDKNILTMIDQKVFSMEKALPVLEAVYRDEQEAKRRFYIMRSRAKALAHAGYVSINAKGFYALSDMGKAVLENFDYSLSYFDYKTFLETSIDRVFSLEFYTAYYMQRGFTKEELDKELTRIKSRLELHRSSGLLEPVEGSETLFFISDRFLNKYKEDHMANKEFQLGKFDQFILRQAKSGVIDIKAYVEGLRGLENRLDDKAIYNKERMFKNRLFLLEREGYVVLIDQDKYLTTGKHLAMKDKTTGEVIKLGKFDKQLYQRFEKAGLTEGFVLDDIKYSFSERDTRFFTGRCVKLKNSGYLVELNDKLFFSERFKDEIMGKIPEFQSREKKEIKVNRFDVNNIFRCNHQGVSFSKESYTKFYMGKEEDFDKFWKRVSKRVENLVEQGYLIPMGEEYLFADKFTEACREHERKLIRMKNRDPLDLNPEQRFILKELQTFLNITQDQFNMKDDLAPELRNLYNRGIIDYENRVINGVNTKVFYLTSEGKQLTSKLTGVQVANIYSSKIHSRPEELQHDVLVYSAYKDAEIRLMVAGKAIVGVRSDRQMRSQLYADKNYEISDLEIEYEDVKTGERGIVNIEVDLGYSESTIKSKAENIKNLVWYSNSESQLRKIERAVPGARTIKL